MAKIPKQKPGTSKPPSKPSGTETRSGTTVSDVIDHLKRTGTGQAKIDICEQVLPGCSRENAGEALRKAGVTPGTIDKVLSVYN